MLYAYIYICIHIYIHAYVHIFIFVRIITYTWWYESVCRVLHIESARGGAQVKSKLYYMWKYTYSHLLICIYRHTTIYVCTYMYSKCSAVSHHVKALTWYYMCINTYTYSFIYIYICIQIYIRTQILNKMLHSKSTFWGAQVVVYVYVSIYLMHIWCVICIFCTLLYWSKYTTR